jgi:hypothetical protein
VATSPVVNYADMPSTVRTDLQQMTDAATAAIPRRTAGNLLIATWNLRAFADLTEKWNAGPNDSPKRDWYAVACIAAM